MSSIDNRIVQMQFENSQFEKGIKQSLKSIEELENSLKFDEAKKSIADLQRVGDSFSLASMANGIDAIGEHFSALSVIGKRVLEDLTDRAVRMGENFVKSLTVDQLSSGFSKYEQDTKSVQTIMFSTGKSIKEVEGQLERLTWFTDETSYSYADMINNIGKFTSMGVPLDESVTAMEGISVWAGLAGQGVNEASRAMYNLSQAMGVGALKMADWRSIQLANMATPDFKKAAIDTAKALGVLNAEGKTLKGTAVNVDNFEATLAEGWLNKDVLLETLRRFGSYADEVYRIQKEEGISAAEAMERITKDFDDFAVKGFKASQQSRTFGDSVAYAKDAVSTGWMKTFKMIFGNYEEAVKLWTEVSEVFYEIFVKSGEARNALLETWKTATEGGRADLIEGLLDILWSLVAVINIVRDAFSSIFPPITVENLQSISLAVKDFGSNLRSMLEPVEVLTGEFEYLTKVIPKNPMEEFEKDLKKGAKSDAVRQLQERLMALNYELPNFGADGVFGPETEAALKKFKEDAGLTVDGIYDEATHKALGKALGFTNYDLITSEKIEKIVSQLPPEAQRLQNILRGIFSIFHIISGVLGTVFKIGGHIVSLFAPLGDAFLTIAAAVGESITSFDKWLTSTGVFDKWFEDAKKALEPFGNFIKGVADALLRFFGLSKDAEKSNEELMTFGKLYNNIIESIKKTGIIDKVKKSWDDFKKAFDKVKTTLKSSWKSVKDSLGEKFTNLLSKIPGAVSSVVTSIGNFVSHGLNLLTPWIEKIPSLVEKIKGFWAALTFEGDEAAGKAPGLLTKIRNAFKSVVDFLFGEGDIENGKQPGLFKRIGAILRDDLEAFTEGLDEETKAKVLSTIQSIKDFLLKVKEAVTLLFGGELGEDHKLSDDTIQSINDFKQTVVDIFTAIGEFFTGVWNTVSGVFQNGIDATTFETFMGSLRGVWDSIVGGLETLGKNGESTAKTIGKTAITIVLLAVIGVIKAITSLIGVIRSLITGETDNETILAIRGFIINIFNSVKGFIDSIVKVVSTLITGKIEDKVTAEKVKPVLEIINTVKDFFVDLWSKISGFFTEHFNAETLEQAKTFIVDIFNTVKGFFVGIWDSARGFFKEKIDDGTIEKVKTFVIGVFNSVKDFFVNLWNSISGFYQEKINDGTIEQVKSFIIGIFNTVKGFLIDVWTSLMKLISGDTSDDKVNAVRDTIDKILHSIGSFFTSIWTIMKELVTGETTNDKIKNFRNTVIGIFNAVKDAIVSIINTIKGLFTGEIKFDSIGGFITQIWEGIKGFVEQIGGVISENYGEATNGLAKFFEKVKASFGKIAKWTIISVIVLKILRFIGNIGGIFTKLNGVIGSMKGTAQPLSKSLMQFAIAVGIIAASIIGLSALKEEQLKRGMAAIREVFTAIGLFIIGSGLLSGMGITKAIAKLGTALRDLAIGIGILAVVAFLLGHDKIAERFNKGLWPLIKVMGLMVGLVAVIAILNKAFGPISASLKGLLELAILIAVMAAIAWALGGVPEENLKRGLTALTGIMVLIALLFLVLGNIPNKGIKMKGLISLAVLIGVMAIIVYGLGKMKKGMWKGVGALAVLMILIGALALVMGAASKDMHVAPMLAFFLGLAAVIFVFGEIIKSIKDVDPWVIVAFSAGLAALMIVLVPALTALSALPILAVLKGCLNLVLVFAALGAALWVFEHLIGSAMDDFGSKLYLLSGDLSRFSNNMSDVGLIEPLKAKLIVGIIVSAFRLMKSVDYSKVDDFSAALTRFGGSIELFNSLTSGLTAEKNQAISDFATTITGALGTLTNLTTNSDSITDALTTIGGAIGLFYGNLAQIQTNEDGEIDTASVQKAFSALGELTIDESAIANVAQYADGEKGSALNDFAIGIQNLSVAIGNYSDQIGGLNPFKVLFANSVLNTIADIRDRVNSINSFGEFMDAVRGKDNKFTLFITDVVALGGALKQYGTDIGGLKIADIVKANLILKTITNLDIPVTGGLIQWVTGSQDFGKFATNIARIGTGLKDYMNEISGAEYNKDKISASLEPLKILGDLQTQLTETGGLKNLVTGTRSVGKVGEQLKEFGGHLVEFSGSVKDFEKTQNITDALDVLSQIVTLQNSITGDVTNWGSIERIGQSLESFFNSLARIETSSTDDMMDHNMTLSDALDAAFWLSTDADPTAIIENITGYFTQIKDTLSAEDSALIAMFKNMGFSLTETMSTGMTEAEFTGPDTVATNAITALNDYQDDFKTVGGNFAVGLGNGINDWSWWPVLAAATVANKMVTTIQTIFDSHSPSKVTTQFGQYFTEGLAIGTKERIGDAESSAEQVANSMLDTASGTLSTLSSLLAEDIDDTPVIAPVVDLTNARATAAQIGSLFGNQDIGVTSQYMAKEAQLSTNNGRPVTIQNGSINTSEAVDGVNERLTALTNAISTQGTGTSDDPRSLADRFSDLAEAVTNLKVVLDSGVLVGEIMPAIDSGLGTYAMRRDRGN